MAEMSHESKRVVSAACAVVTISDTRTPVTDRGGPLVVEQLQSSGHRVIVHEIVPDDIDRIGQLVEKLCAMNCDVIVLTGGTGIAPRDHAYETLFPMLEKRLDGFAELFRSLSFAEIGAAAMLSRALAGTRGKSIIFSLPGSPNAVRLGMERLILPVLPHAVALLRT